MDSSSSKRKGQPHKKDRNAFWVGSEIHAKLMNYADGKGKKHTAKMIVEDSVGKTIKFDMYGETWDDIELDPRAREELLKYSQTHGNIPRSVILSQWIMECKNFDFRKEKWTEELAESREEENLYAWLDGACEGLAHGKDKSKTDVYSCVWFMEGGPPKVRLLGHTESVTKKKCAACRRTEEIKRGLAERDAKIEELETKIQMKAKTSRKVPVCNKGAILSQEGTAFRSCPKSSIPVSVATYCKVLSGGLPCALYAEIELSEGPL